MSFKKSNNPKNMRFYIRFEENEKESLRQSARLCGMTMSDYVRKRALGKRIVPKVDVDVLNELRRQGGNLRDLLTNYRPIDAGVAKETLAAFREVVSIIDRRME